MVGKTLHLPYPVLYSPPAMRPVAGKGVSVVVLIALAGFTLGWSMEIDAFHGMACGCGGTEEKGGHEGFWRLVGDAQSTPCLHQVTRLAPASQGGFELPLAGSVGGLSAPLPVGFSYLSDAEFPARAPPVTAR